MDVIAKGVGIPHRFRLGLLVLPADLSPLSVCHIVQYVCCADPHDEFYLIDTSAPFFVTGPPQIGHKLIRYHADVCGFSDIRTFLHARYKWSAITVSKCRTRDNPDAVRASQSPRVVRAL